MASLMSILKQAGFTGNGLKMAYAIAMAESGGNAKAHNGNSGTGDNSYGLFQINMLGAMGPERRRQYGLSSNDSLFDPLTNAKVAFKMSGGGAHWGPWSTYGNGAYKKYYGGSSASVKNSSSSGGGGGGGSTAKSKSETAEDYGFMLTLFDSNPELKKLFNKAVDKGYSPSKFQAELRDTKWWKTHTQQQRDFLTLKYGDPATANQKLKDAEVHVRQLAESMGLRAGPGIEKKINTWALNMAMNGWDDSRLRWDIGKSVSFRDDVRQGEGGEVIDKLHDLAYNMGVTMSASWYADSARAVLRGTGSQQDYEDWIRKSAKSMFPGWSKQIDAGQTVADLANPYMSSMAQILELPPGSVNLFDPTIKKALTYKDPKTGASAPKALWQFENDIRSDNRWKSTQNAQNSMMQVAHQILADFGVKN